MRRHRTRKAGQVLIMVSLALMLMFGMLGLAVDLGFSYFTKKSAQAAADAAALAAVNQAFFSVGEEGSYSCGGPLDCGQTMCPGGSTGSTFRSGCLYAAANGFGAGERKWVQLEAGAWDGTTPVSPPTAPGVHVYYWVTARVGDRLPTLFSAVMGNWETRPAARATAGVVDAPILATLILLNRENDWSGLGGPRGRYGVDLTVAGGTNVYGGQGITLASEAHGPEDYAGAPDTGSAAGSATVSAPFTYIRGEGTVSPNVIWTSTEPGVPGWENGFPDRSYFKDPFRGRGQPAPPPPPPSAEYLCPVPETGIQGPITLGPGYYYTVDQNTGKASGKPIQIKGEVRFASGGKCFSTPSCPSCGGVPDGTGFSGGYRFGEYVFFGGLHFPATQTVAIFEPGRYVVAGVLPKGSNPGTLFYFTNQVKLIDNTTPTGFAQPNKEGDAGEIFILTDANYPGLYVPPAVEAIRSQLKFGIADFQSGHDVKETLIDLHGLNNDRLNSGYNQVPPELNGFRPVVIWQDQRNSYVRYTSYGQIDCGQADPAKEGPCTGGYSLDEPKYNTSMTESPLMKLQAGPQSSLYGAIYQPRGAWMDLQGSPGAQSPLQVVSGAINVHGGGDLRLRGVNNPIMRRIVGLIE